MFSGLIERAEGRLSGALTILQTVEELDDAREKKSTGHEPVLHGGSLALARVAAHPDTPSQKDH
jgi:hypothetical protein